MSEEFANKLKNCFGNTDLKGGQTRLANYLRIKPQAVQQWMSGETEPRQNRYKQIAAFFNMSEQEFRFGSKKEEAQDLKSHHDDKTLFEVKEMSSKEVTMDLIEWIELYKISSKEERAEAKRLLVKPKATKNKNPGKGKEGQQS